LFEVPKNLAQINLAQINIALQILALKSIQVWLGALTFSGSMLKWCIELSR
jgi:hypothetical protein